MIILLLCYFITIKKVEANRQLLSHVNIILRNIICRHNENIGDILRQRILILTF